MTLVIPTLLAFLGWYSTERRIGTRDEWVALFASLVGWVAVIAVAVVS